MGQLPRQPDRQGPLLPLIAVFVPRVNFDEYAQKVTQFSDAIKRRSLSPTSTSTTARFRGLRTGP